MKPYSLILISLITLLTLSCRQGADHSIPGDVVHIPKTAQGETDMNALPVIEFEKDFHDFGRVIEGEVVTYSFKFKNSGKADLMIADITSSCGCTATEYPKKPMKSGEEDYIKVTFNSERRSGYQYKTVTVLANTNPAKTVLNIKAEVVLPEKDY